MTSFRTFSRRSQRDRNSRPNEYLGELIARDHAGDKNVKVVWPGVMTSARFDFIVTSSTVLKDIKVGTKSSRSWFEDYLMTRLSVPDAKVIIVP